jgi:hypothetical protein
MNWMKHLALPLLALAIAGCAHRYPMGLSEAQWSALSPQEQAKYQAEQYALDEQNRQAARAERAAREQAKRDEIAAEQARVAQLYEQARYGDIVRVTIHSGHLDIHGRSRPAQPVAFEIAKGERKLVTLTQAGQVNQSFAFPVTLSLDGNTLTFDAGSSQAMVMVNTDWEKGQLYTSPPSSRGGITLRNATFFVKLKDLPGAPQRVGLRQWWRTVQARPPGRR